MWPGVIRKIRFQVAPSTVGGAGILCLALLTRVLVGHGEVLPDSVRLRFANRPAEVRLSEEGRSLLVEFSGPIADGEAARTASNLGPLLAGYSEGYGAIRYTFAAPVHVVRDAQDGSAITITTTSESAPDPAAAARLELVEARMQAQSGDVQGARDRLTQLVARRPADPDPALALAELETQAGRWQHALGVYDGALGLFPQADDIARDRKALAIRMGPQVKLDGLAVFGPGGERVQSATTSVELPLSESWRFGASFQTSHDETRNLRRSGLIDPTNYSATKLLTDIDIAHEWAGGFGTSRVDLFAAPQTVGARAQHQFTTTLGETTAAAVYHQPYWGTVMAFAANAWRDQAGLTQTISLPERWQVQLGGGVVRYGVPQHDHVAAGPSLSAEVSKGLPEQWMPIAEMDARLGWRVEAEYLGAVATMSSPLGALTLLDVRRREIHSLYAESHLPIGPGTATALVGYAIDRFGGSGPQALMRYASGVDSDPFTFSLEAGLEPSLDLKPRTLFHVGGLLIWRFGGS